MRHAGRGVVVVACAAALAACFDFGGLKPKGDAGVRDADESDGADSEVSVPCAEKTYACDDDELVTTCVDGSKAPTRETCALGCDASAKVCGALVPGFVNEEHRDWAVLGEYELIVTSTFTLNTETGTLTQDGEDDIALEFELEDQDEGAPKLAVFRLARFEVTDGARLQFVGKHAVALVVRGEVVINGTIDVSADEATGGPGGASGDVADAELTEWPLNGGGTRDLIVADRAVAAPGGGGGSNGAAGGAGGNAHATGYQENPLAPGGQGPRTASADGGAAGTAFADTADWAGSLVGGGSGGPASCGQGTGDDLGVRGGGGGGALLVSASGGLILGTDAVLIASGAGGRARKDYVFKTEGNPISPCSAYAGAGGGGGAGGTIVLESSTASFLGSVFANGGGGGGGATAEGGMTSKTGKDGLAEAGTAAGGVGSVGGAAIDRAGTGGAGGAAEAHDGLSPPETEAGYVNGNVEPRARAYAGGGGGGVGRIVIRVLPDADLPEVGTFSPSEAPALRATKDAATFTPTRP